MSNSKEYLFNAHVYSDKPNVPAGNIVGGYVWQAQGFYGGRSMTPVFTNEDQGTAIGKVSADIRETVRRWGRLAAERYPYDSEWEIRVWRP